VGLSYHFATKGQVQVIEHLRKLRKEAQKELEEEARLTMIKYEYASTRRFDRDYKYFFKFDPHVISKKAFFYPGNRLFSHHPLFLPRNRSLVQLYSGLLFNPSLTANGSSPSLSEEVADFFKFKPMEMDRNNSL
jgi:hypothetical protein